MNSVPRAAGLWGPVVLLAVVITWLSHIPNLAPPGNIPDWVGHLGEYGTLGVLVGRAISAGERRLAFRRALTAAVAMLGFAALDEVHQMFVVGRSASVRDWSFDMLAIGAGLSAVAVWRGRAAGTAPEVLLVGRKGCHLCDEAEAVMRPVLDEMGIGMSKVDVDADERLATRYGHEVPVVLINGRKAFKYHVDPARLRRKLGSTLRGRV